MGGGKYTRFWKGAEIKIIIIIAAIQLVLKWRMLDFKLLTFISEGHL